jgi:hypothetical protein
MMAWQLPTMKNVVRMMLKDDPTRELPCEMIARTCGIEDVEIVRAEINRVRASVPPNSDFVAEGK